MSKDKELKQIVSLNFIASRGGFTLALPPPNFFI